MYSWRFSKYTDTENVLIFLIREVLFSSCVNRKKTVRITITTTQCLVDNIKFEYASTLTIKIYKF